MTDQELKMWQDDVKMISKLREENEELKLIIDKAVKYIEGCTSPDEILLNMLKQIELIGNR